MDEKQKPWFISFKDIDGDLHMIAITSIQVVLWIDKGDYGVVGVHGRCPVRIDKKEWARLITELSCLKINEAI